MRTPSQGDGVRVGPKRLEPTGGVAYGTPRNVSTVVDGGAPGAADTVASTVRTTPWSFPYRVCTTRVSVAADAAGVHSATTATIAIVSATAAALAVGWPFIGRDTDHRRRFSRPMMSGTAAGDASPVSAGGWTTAGGVGGVGDAAPVSPAPATGVSDATDAAGRGGAVAGVPVPSGARVAASSTSSSTNVHSRYTATVHVRYTIVVVITSTTPESSGELDSRSTSSNSFIRRPIWAWATAAKRCRHVPATDHNNNKIIIGL